MKPLGQDSELLRFWGKARPSAGSGAAWHPCVYHCLDVAAVGEAFLAADPDLPAGIARDFGWQDEGCRKLLLFLLTLHDVGKLSQPFQALAPDHWPAEVLGTLKRYGREPRHGSAGFVLLNDLLPAHPTFEGWRSRRLEMLLSPVVGHHGRPVTPPDGFIEEEVFGPTCRQAARTLIDVAAALFEPEPMPAPNVQALARASWRFAGLCVLADWLGSNERWFPYAEASLSAEEYFRTCARPRARDALLKAGTRPARPASAMDFSALTGINEAPSPVQLWAARVPLPDGPCLALIEDMTGSGKTEAALMLAHRLIAARRARGLYVALPSMATANAMYDRLSRVYRRLFECDERPSLALAHARDRMHEGFRDSVLSLGGVPSNETEEVAETTGDAAGAACAAWLADSRRKAFLADVGVGTIDQALLAVLPAKHQSLRLFGLKDRVLVVDEAHAYDAYMGQELQRLLEFHAALGGSAIVLSATLPQKTRSNLASAFARGLGRDGTPPIRNDYPLVTLVGRKRDLEVPSDARPGLGRELRVTRLGSATEAVQRAVAAAGTGAAVAWIRNTVDDAIEGVTLIRERRAKADLFHARFALADRLAIEKRVVDRFGKDGEADGRAGILVATQVIEQSLDLDFDLVISDLAPVDLLLQRAGRLWRHVRETRPAPGPELLVVAPDPAEPVAADWYSAMFPGAAHVYTNHALLWLTAQKLFGRFSWRVPEDVRELVEHVYRADAAGHFPEALQQNADRAEGEEKAAVWIAKENLLRLDKGYALQDQPWDEDKRVPTRLGDPTVILRLARSAGTALVPWHDDPDPHRAWALSEVSVRANRAHADAIPSDLRRAAGTARAGWTRHDEATILVPLAEAAPGRFEGAVLDPRGATRQLLYSRDEGLRFA